MPRIARATVEEAGSRGLLGPGGTVTEAANRHSSLLDGVIPAGAEDAREMARRAEAFP